MGHFILATFLAALLAYLLGSCNSAILFSKLIKGQDIRELGSHNAGLTNTLRCFGKGMAGLVLAGDLLKGVAAVLLARLMCSLMGAGLPFPSGDDTTYIGYIAGIFAILGHVRPLYYGFRGGKGVLVGVSIFLVVEPVVFAVLIGIFSLVLWRSKYVSLGSIIATCFCPVVTCLLHLFVYHTSVIHTVLYVVLSAIMSAQIIFMHRSNMERLRSGTENRFSFRSKKA